MRYRILGPVEVIVGGSAVYLGGPREHRTLAGLLLWPNRTVSGERLAHILWGDQPPPTASTQIRNTIATLRRNLAAAAVDEEPIVRVGGGFQARVGDDQLDSLVFERQLARARYLTEAREPNEAAAALRMALSLWRGPALGGLGGPVLGAAAHGLEEQRMACLERRIELDLALGNHADLVGEIATLVREHPLRERLVELEMLCLHRNGRREDALAAFSAARTRLADGLGLDPRPELVRLHEAILRADASLDVAADGVKVGAGPARGDAAAGRLGPVPRQLPPALPRLVGRADELTAVIDALTRKGSGQPAVIAIHGSGGVGKSSLAVAAAHACTDAYPDGQLYVDLQGAAATLAPLAVGDVVGRFLRALGVAPAQVPSVEAEAISLYRTLTAGRRILIVADNAGSAEQVAPLLPAAPSSAVIATSRQVLGMLDGAVRIDLQPLREADAEALLASFAGADRAAAEPAAVATVAQACGRLPLALRIAGARLVSRPDWAVSDLARRLADERRVLHELNAADETLRASLQVSWHELHAGDRSSVDALAARIFLALGAIRVPTVPPGLAAALCATTPELAELALDRLVAARLIDLDQGRYRMHDLLRRFAAELAMEDPDRRQMLGAALSWYASAADQLGRLMRGAVRPTGRSEATVLTEVTDAASAGEWLDGQRGNLVALVRQALTESPETSRLAAELVLSLYPAILMRGHAYEWEVLCRSVLDAADRITDPKLVAYVWTRLSVMFAIQLRTDEALECLDHAVPLHRISGDRSGEASALEAAGMALTRQGQHERALSRFDEALRLRAGLGERHATGITLSNAAEALHRLGRNREALRYLERSLQIRREEGDLAGEGTTLLNLGEVHAELGDLVEAIGMADAAVECCRRAGERENQRRSVELRARLRLRMGDLAAARADCELVLDLAGSSDSVVDLSELIVALDAAGQRSLAQRLRRRTAGPPAASPTAAGPR